LLVRDVQSFTNQPSAKDDLRVPAGELGDKIREVCFPPSSLRISVDFSPPYFNPFYRAPVFSFIMMHVLTILSGFRCRQERCR
jgi:hypothetical protein